MILRGTLDPGNTSAKGSAERYRRDEGHGAGSMDEGHGAGSMGGRRGLGRQGQAGEGGEGEAARG